jgi:VPDSG-CTERM motif
MLRMLNPGKILVAVLALAGITHNAAANSVTVQEMGVGSCEVVEMTSSTLGDHWVYAGILNLQINGVATQGFCIDPFHWSINGPQTYNFEPLASAPKDPVNGMGALKALEIEQLWAQYYSSDMSNEQAAGLQIAIWDIVGGSSFQLDSGNDYGASGMLTWVTGHSGAPTANLIAVTGPGQDYVIPNSSVPDAGETAVLLGMGLAGIALMRSKAAKKA